WNLIVRRPIDSHVPIAVRHGGDHDRAARELGVSLPRLWADQAIFSERIAARPDHIGPRAPQAFIYSRDVPRRLTARGRRHRPIAGVRAPLHLPGGERLVLFGGVILHDQPRVGDPGLAQTTVPIIPRFAGASDGVNDPADRLPRPDADGDFGIIAGAFRGPDR